LLFVSVEYTIQTSFFYEFIELLTKRLSVWQRTIKLQVALGCETNEPEESWLSTNLGRSVGIALSLFY
jgi:hypothetical protein